MATWGKVTNHDGGVGEVSGFHVTVMNPERIVGRPISVIQKRIIFPKYTNIIVLDRNNFFFKLLN